MTAQPSNLLALVPADSADALAAGAEAAGLELHRATTVSELFELLASRQWAATVLSLSMPHVDEAVAARIGQEHHGGPLLLSIAGVSLESAMLMERVGAVVLLREPLGEDDVRARLAGVAAEGRAVRVTAPPRTEDGASGAPVLVGESAAMGTVFETVARVARSDATVLITGESGTGKEVIARALHWASDRRDEPFVAVNCAAIPEHLLESELFGHERGAFTGAVARRVGRFERADGGTIFLDEIGDMSLVLQAKVLRVLEERTVERVGGGESFAVDVRVLAATNQELGAARAEGRFREDLYFRLAVVDVHLPPLRERGADIRSLALHFAGDFSRRHGKEVDAITESALRRLQSAPWPGNVRELRNVMDRAVLLATDGTIRSGDLRLGAADGAARVPGARGHGYPTTLSLADVEAEHIRRVLAVSGGQIGEAATVLGIHRNTLTRKLKEYAIDPRSRGGASA